MMAMSFHRVDLRVPGFGQVIIEVSSICNCGCEKEMVSIVVKYSPVLLLTITLCAWWIFFHIGAE